jgi:hypothetical protein
MTLNVRRGFRHTERVRPDPDQLLQSLRVSLAETIVPALDDRWARYVAAAMDLVLHHLQLRLAGEADAIAADNADLAHTLAAIAADVATAPRPYAAIRDALAPPPLAGDGTAVNEALRGQLVDLLHALDATPEDARVDAWRDQALRLVRREVDRVNPLVAPLYMTFSPAPSA